jgi:hypothetical protein
MKTLWLVNDDKDFTRWQQQDIAEVWPKAKVTTAVSLYELREKTKGPDVLLIDISAIAPIAAGAHHCYGPICAFHEKFPGTTIIINSCVSSYFLNDVRDMVMEKCPAAVVLLIDWASAKASNVLKRLLEAV